MKSMALYFVAVTFTVNRWLDVLIQSQAIYKSVIKESADIKCSGPEHKCNSIGTISAKSVESDLGSISRVYFDNVTLMSHNVMLTSQKPCQYNNKSDCSETNIPQDAINAVYVFFFDKILL